MADVLNVTIRNTRGSREARRLRKSGAIPAVLYGHMQETISLAVPADELSAVLRHGGHVVRLQGAVRDTALIREVQWDVWGSHVLHVDFARVSEDERVEVEIPIELRGEAPGAREGGMLEHLLHSIRVACSATSVPDRIQVRINELGINQSITVGDLSLPAGVTVLADPQTVVVQCVPARAVPAEEEPALPGAAEPELIGRKPSEEEEDQEK
jgi:large subunit ribosomal protein L25